MIPKTIVTIPAYNAAKTLRKTIDALPLSFIDEVILVDDQSPDNTFDVATNICNDHPKLTLDTSDTSRVLCTLIKHTKNTGYGGNQKTCYNTALAHGADIIIMIHGDFQYDPTAVPLLREFIEKRQFDCMLGSRIRSRTEALTCGMPYYKYIANRCLSSFENLVTGRVLTDWHTGMRAYTKEVLNSVPYQTFSDDFIFDTQMLLGIIRKKYTIGEVPIPVRYFEEASSINFKRSLKYGLLTLRELVFFTFKK
jgi:glycosyltransferase involved in cell wall biosynthesis